MIKREAMENNLDFDEVEFFIKKYNSLHRNFELMQEVLNSKQLKAYFECAQYLKYVLIKTEEGEYIKKLVSANFCKNRFCSICNWRRALKYRVILNNRIQKILENKKVKFIFLTLTTRNVYYLNLKKEIKKILNAFTRLFKFKRVSQNLGILGYVRSLEFTIQKNNLDYINLHIHVLVVVTPGYFDTRKNFYINQREWAKLWQKALRVDYTPIVDVRVVRKRKKSNYTAEELAIFEVVKYILKDTDLLLLQKQKKVYVFKELYRSFKNVRNLASGGILAPKNFKKKISEEEDLVNVKGSEVQGKIVGEVEYILKDGNYQLLRFKGEENECKKNQNRI